MGFKPSIDQDQLFIGGDTGFAANSIKIGRDVDKVGLYSVDPVIQPVGSAQGDQGTMTTVGSNTGTAAAGLSLIGDTTSVDQAANLMNDLVALQEDIAALDVLVTAMRTAMIDTGVMKGAA